MGNLQPYNDFDELIAAITMTNSLAKLDDFSPKLFPGGFREGFRALSQKGSGQSG